MGRTPCCDKANVKKGPWSPEEDEKLKDYLQTHGTGGNWITLPQKAGLRRCGKSCRLRWLNYLRPNIKHGEFSDDEDKVICTLFASIGSRWSTMAAQLPGRTDNDIKNYWNTKLKKKMMSSSISMQETRKKLHPSTAAADHHHQVLQSQNHRCSGLNPREGFQGVKDSSTLVMFAGDHQASSDGSCHYEFGRNYEKGEGYFGDSSLDSSLEEIRQLISTNLCTSNNIDNNLNFFLDDTKEVDEVMY